MRTARRSSLFADFVADDATNGCTANGSDRAAARQDGTADGALRLERVLTNDPGTGVMRHADAGYDRAIEVARERGVRLPMQGT